MLTTGELKQRLDRVLEGAERFLRSVARQSLKTLLPNRPRSYADLIYHIFNIADAFLEEKQGVLLTLIHTTAPAPEASGKQALSPMRRIERLSASPVWPRDRLECPRRRLLWRTKLIIKPQRTTGTAASTRLMWVGPAFR